MTETDVAAFVEGHEIAAGVMWHPGELSPVRAGLSGR